jgi:hypothetical protein
VAVGVVWMAATSASMSARVLYSASEARAVAGTPKRVITGCAQWCPVRMATPMRSRMVPMSCGWTPSITNETDAPPCRGAVPTRRTPGWPTARAVRVGQQIRFVRGDPPKPMRRHVAGGRAEADAPSMCGVPASNL